MTKYHLKKRIDIVVEAPLTRTLANQLDAANVNTQGYKSFIVGVTIVIPAKTGC